MLFLCFLFRGFLFFGFFGDSVGYFFFLKSTKISLSHWCEKIVLHMKLAWNLQPHNHKHKIDILQSVNWDMTEGLHVLECEQMAEPCITVPSQNLGFSIQD